MRFVLCLLAGLSFSCLAHARNLSDLRTFGDLSTTTLYLFTSPSCPHCRDFHKGIFPDLLKQYVNTKKIQIAIVDMPFDETTMQAVMLMRCLPEQKSAKMMGWLYENQSKWTQSSNPKFLFQQYAGALGMKSAEVEACLNNDQLRSDIEDQRNNLSALYGVRGWPTVALRHGNNVKLYTGTDRRAILTGVKNDIRGFIEEDKKRQLQKKKK